MPDADTAGFRKRIHAFKDIFSAAVLLQILKQLCAFEETRD